MNIKKGKIIDITPIVSIDRGNINKNSDKYKFRVEYVIKFSDGTTQNVKFSINAPDEETALRKSKKILKNGIEISLSGIDKD